MAGKEIAMLIVFFVTCGVVVISALIAVFARSVINAAFALFFTLCGMAGFYFLLSADFLAIVQIVVYAGGILVLLLFGILLTHRTLEELGIEKRTAYIAGSVAGLAFYLILVFIIALGVWHQVPPKPMQPTTATIGKLLLTKYLLPFEISSITLLAALIGSAYLVRRKEGE